MSSQDELSFHDLREVGYRCQCSFGCQAVSPCTEQPLAPDLGLRKLWADDSFFLHSFPSVHFGPRARGCQTCFACSQPPKFLLSRTESRQDIPQAALSWFLSLCRLVAPSHDGLLYHGGGDLRKTGAGSDVVLACASRGSIRSHLQPIVRSRDDSRQPLGSMCLCSWLHVS